jgi:uncharacterized membrane protein YcfT
MSAPASSRPLSRISWIDTAKGFTIILVVMMHSSLGVSKEMLGNNFMLALVNFAQPFRIPAFFLLSGLLLTRAIDRPWRTYLDNKVIHFVYFYILWLSIQFAFKGPGMAAESGWLQLLQDYLMAYIQPFGTLWFIYLLPVFFVATKLLRSTPLPIALSLLAALEIAHIETGAVVIDEFCSRFVYFYAGYALHAFLFNYAKHVADRSAWSFILILGWGILNLAAVQNSLFLPFLGGKTEISLLPFVSLLLGGSGSLALIAIAVWMTRIKWQKIFEACGKNSLVIYLAFFLPMAAARIVLIKTGLIPSAGIISLIVTCAAVAAPLLLYKLIKHSGYGLFLFERPRFAHLENSRQKDDERI